MANFVAIENIVLNVDAIAYARQGADGSVEVFFQVEEHDPTGEGRPAQIYLEQPKGSEFWHYLATTVGWSFKGDRPGS